MPQAWATEVLRRGGGRCQTWDDACLHRSLLAMEWNHKSTVFEEAWSHKAGIQGGASALSFPPQMRGTLSSGRFMLLSAASCGREGSAQDCSWQVCSPKNNVCSAMRRGEGWRGQCLKAFYPSPACRQHLPSVTRRASPPLLCCYFFPCQRYPRGRSTRGRGQ